MIEHCNHNLTEIRSLLDQINTSQYSTPLTLLSGSTIGQHVRHILEFYQCLLKAENGIVNYDQRERNLTLETNIYFAQSQIDNILKSLAEAAPTTELTLQGNYTDHEGHSDSIPTTYQRELAYCLEHSIHHQALIKVGLKELNIENIINRNFGVAPATIRYQNQCAQ